MSQIALVTGAAVRVGRAIALGLARAGWDVAVHYSRSADAAQATVAEIRALGQRAVSLSADLADEAQTIGLLSACADSLGEARCVVNNAALFEYDDATTFSHAALEAHMRVNLAAPVILARELHRRLPDTAVGDAAGVVINLLDQKLFNYNPDFLSYTLSKAGLQAATTMLAQALAPRVRVVGVAPGLTLVSRHQSAANFVAGQARVPLERASQPDDIAAAVVYLAGAAAVTGTILAVDGGEHLRPATRDVMFINP